MANKRLELKDICVKSFVTDSQENNLLGGKEPMFTDICLSHNPCVSEAIGC